MWRIERQRRVWKPYGWVLMLSSYGAAGGHTWTRRGAERELMRVQSEWFAER